MENLYLFILLAFFAEVLGTIGGFGSSLFFVPIASYFVDFHHRNPQFIVILNV